MFDAAQERRAELGPEAVEAEANRLESEMSAVCGQLNATTAKLVGLVARALETGCWAGAGVRSPEHYVVWQCGVSASHARRIVAMAERLSELPATAELFAEGQLAEDQVGAICRRTPTHNDAEVAELAQSATVPQLQHVLRKYPLQRTETEREPKRRAGFGWTDEGWWRLSALLPPDEGALVEKALGQTRDDLRADAAEGTGDDDAKVSWADALAEVADRSLSPGATGRPARERSLVLLHVDADNLVDPDEGEAAHVHLGGEIDRPLLAYWLCDANFRAVLERDGIPVSVGRTTETVPERTRRLVEDRDGKCRVPWCSRSKWLQVHHITHQANGGAHDTSNLCGLCEHDHKLHHLGLLGIAGDADDPDGLVFTDEHGKVLTPSGRPAPPGDPPKVKPYRHPTGEHLEAKWISFSDAPPRPEPPSLN